MPDNNSKSPGDGQNGEEHGRQTATFDMPEETTQTALNKDDRTSVVDLQTGQEVPEPVANSKESENLVLVCLDPSKKHDQYEVGVERPRTKALVVI
jgi:hypothetical protein